MLAIQGLKCIYDTGSRGWAIELVLSGEGEEAMRRFDVDGPDDAEMLIDAFEDSSASAFDPVTGEIVFAYEYADLDDDEDGSEDDDLADDEDEEDVSPDETSGDEGKGKA
jgi:hypothetical protein